MLVGMAEEKLLIEVCPTEERADALRLLNAGLSADQQTALPLALYAVRSQRDEAFTGLLVARLDSSLAGATWVQWAPGRTAVLWPPAIGGQAAVELMREAESLIHRRQIPMAQILISPDAPQDPKLLAEGGFRRLVDLEYLTLESSHFPTGTSEGRLEFQPRASDRRDRFGELLLRTYEQTLDCPQINGLRSIDDILDSYAAQGNFAPERWFIVRQDRQDVGVLILTEYEQGGNWELVYMGVVPEARGQQLGERIVHFAIQQAALAGAARLVLAADADNAPALAMYHAAGLVTWDRRRVYARLSPEHGARSK